MALSSTASEMNYSLEDDDDIDSNIATTEEKIKQLEESIQGDSKVLAYFKT
jgi:hypothetical protein